MKKLLLLSSFIVFLAYSCQRKQVPASSESRTDTKPLVNTDAIVAKDTLKTEGQTPVSGSSKQTGAGKKDSIHSSGKPTAITHPSSEQEKLDSIKKAKLKDQQ